MIVSTLAPQNIPENPSRSISLEEWAIAPPDGTEWVDEQLIDKTGMTLRHGQVQADLASDWKIYANSSGQGGRVYTEAPCLTNKQGRRPDVAYLTPELVDLYGNNDVLPQSFPLIAEIISTTDLAESVIAKSQEYLQSGCQEIWLIYPESKWAIVVTQNQRLVFTVGEVITTQVVLKGFSISVDELLA
jgi:Uma2 family endonuclease